MKKIICTCDHCGKELDGMNDYTDIQIDDFIDYVNVDLCLDCFRELNEIILRYVNQKQG